MVVLIATFSLLSCAPDPSPADDVVETLLEGHRADLQAILESDRRSYREMQLTYIAWEVVVSQDRTRDWDTEQLIDGFQEAYQDLQEIGLGAVP